MKDRLIGFFKKNATLTTVLILTIIYIVNAYLFGNGMGMVEIIITLLTFLYFVWGFNLQFWKTNRKIDREE
jgi:hypothetical protein